MQKYQPELEIKKSHDVRKLEPCVCGGLGMRPNMVKVDGEWWHGRCAIERFGVEKIAALGKAATGGLRWSEIGTDAMRRLVESRTETG